MYLSAYLVRGVKKQTKNPKPHNNNNNQQKQNKNPTFLNISPLLSQQELLTGNSVLEKKSFIPTPQLTVQV